MIHTPSPACPHLGLRADPATRCAYPTPENCCHRPARPESVDDLYQSMLCLRPEHVHCPVFRETNPWHGALPDGIGAKLEAPRRRWLAMVGIATLFLLGVALLAVAVRTL